MITEELDASHNQLVAQYTTTLEGKLYQYQYSLKQLSNNTIVLNTLQGRTGEKNSYVMGNDVSIEVRPLETAAVSMKRGDNGQLDVQDYYQINQKSPDCPMGFSQEETLKRLWESEEDLRELVANPENSNDYGAKDIFDGLTGMKLPERVVVYGSFQPYVGAVKNDSNSEVTRMYYIGNNTYALSVVIPFAGEYDYAVSTYGTLSATYSHDVYPRSGSSNKGFLTGYSPMGQYGRYPVYLVSETINIT